MEQIMSAMFESKVRLDPDPRPLKRRGYHLIAALVVSLGTGLSSSQSHALAVSVCGTNVTDTNPADNVIHIAGTYGQCVLSDLAADKKARVEFIDEDGRDRLVLTDVVIRNAGPSDLSIFPGRLNFEHLFKGGPNGNDVTATVNLDGFWVTGSGGGIDDIDFRGFINGNQIDGTLDDKRLAAPNQLMFSDMGTEEIAVFGDRTLRGELVFRLLSGHQFVLPGSASVQDVPLPGTIALFGAGLVALLGSRRFLQKSAA